MYILGLNIGHNATAALLHNGKILGCISEERFSRVKNHSGIPHTAIHTLMSEANITFREIEYVVLDDHYDIDTDPNFGKRFLEAYTKKPFSKRLLSQLGYKFPALFSLYAGSKESKEAAHRKHRAQMLKRVLARSFSLKQEQILVIDHHLAHAYSPCFNLSQSEKTLIFTLDGEGSGLCATVSIFDGKNLQTISRTKKAASLGYLYSLATIHLGMKPLEHEFKVMGLAPYAKEHNIQKIYDSFKGLIRVTNDLRFESRFNMPFADHFFAREMRFQRFDVISGAVQKLVEERVCEWITKAIQKTGIHSIALSGGVFMNVKANMRIAELPEVKKLFIMPSCGDESNPFGCCYYGYAVSCHEQNLPVAPEPFTHLYLGPDYDDTYIKKLIEKKDLSKRYTIRKLKNITAELARLLARGEIVARCTGKSEWGARALGNRSILANPAREDTIRILNETIKDRDFWMPFTPSILDTYADSYFNNSKHIATPYMVLTFGSTSKAQKELPAAMHPYDFTLRPQVVTREHNKEYYDLISAFAKKTGVGALLNTSFNLHGEPNVLTPEDALHTVENSDLKYLALGSYLFMKKRAK
ncbi:carbamoyltransferase [Candidatus Pacearchaeota archaeon]|nr:carbamoyltransferase [Candidatus Pacearchaeota archaeon]